MKSMKPSAHLNIISFLMTCTKKINKATGCSIRFIQNCTQVLSLLKFYSSVRPFLSVIWGHKTTHFVEFQTRSTHFTKLFLISKVGDLNEKKLLLREKVAVSHLKHPNKLRCYQNRVLVGWCPHSKCLPLFSTVHFSTHTRAYKFSRRVQRFDQTTLQSKATNENFLWKKFFFVFLVLSFLSDPSHFYPHFIFCIFFNGGGGHHHNLADNCRSGVCLPVSVSKQKTVLAFVCCRLLLIALV